MEEKREEVMRVGNNNINTANGYNNSIESKLRRSHHVDIPREEANTTGSFVTLQNQYHDEWTISQAMNVMAGNDVVFYHSGSAPTQNLTASNLISSRDQLALTSLGEGNSSDMHRIASASLDGLSSTGSSSHPAFHSFPGGEINNNSTSSASSEFGDNLVRPEILTVVGGAQSGGKIERGRDSTIEGAETP